MEATIFSNDFNRIIQATKQFAHGSVNHSINKYIRLEFTKNQVTAIATDGYRLSVEHAVAECSENFSCYIMPSVNFKKNTYVGITLENDEVLMRFDGYTVGFHQPDGEYINWNAVIERVKKPTFRIAFNGEYILSALQAAKASSGGSYKTPVFLEFTGNTDPLIIRTNKTDIKYILPMRIQNSDTP